MGREYPVERYAIVQNEVGLYVWVTLRHTRSRYKVLRWLGSILCNCKQWCRTDACQ